MLHINDSHDPPVQTGVTIPIKTYFTLHKTLNGFHDPTLTYCALVESILYSSVYLDRADMVTQKGEFSIKGGRMHIKNKQKKKKKHAGKDWIERNPSEEQ